MNRAEQSARQPKSIVAIAMGGMIWQRKRIKRVRLPGW